MSILRMQDIPLTHQRVLIREDLNVPLQNGEITSTQRLEAALPTIIKARDAGAKVMIMSHLGRPQEGIWEADSSLQPVADWLTQALKQPVCLIRDYLDGVTVTNGEVVLLENCRMNLGENKNNEVLAKQYAALCDVFVMDAFGTAHRAQASTEGVIHHAPTACAGPLLCAELDALGKAFENPKRPLLAIVAGSKVSSKLVLLLNLLNKVDQLIIGGGIANTFIAALGYSVGQSLYEQDLIPKAQEILEAAQKRGLHIPIPSDVVVAKEFSANATPTIKSLSQISADDRILDIGPETARQYAQLIQQASSVVWNGPVGVFEFPAFSHGTEVIAQAIATTPAFSLAGGGDTLAAIDQFGIASKLDFISTGGGAFLEFLEGKELPAVSALRKRAAEN